MMIYSICGVVLTKKDGFAVVEVNAIGYKIFFPVRVMETLPSIHEEVRVFCHLRVREDAHELYGFLRETELAFFEKLLTVNGVGPKSALAIMALASSDELAAAINEGKPDMLTRASGVGRKTAERVVLELRGKLPIIHSEDMVRRMESDMDIEEALMGLGYSRAQAKKAIIDLPAGLHGLEARLRAALKELKK